MDAVNFSCVFYLYYLYSESDFMNSSLSNKVRDYAQVHHQLGFAFVTQALVLIINTVLTNDYNIVLICS